jgi:hypothetical protein
VQGVTWVFDSDSTHELAQNKEGLNWPDARFRNFWQGPFELHIKHGL